MTDEVSSRLSGAFLLVLAMIGTSWMELRFQRESTYSIEWAMLMPLTIAIALDLLLHAPKVPVETMTARDGFYVALGTLVGLFNLHRFGAFAEGSSARMPLFVGFGCACAYFALAAVRKYLRD